MVISLEGLKSDVYVKEGIVIQAYELARELGVEFKEIKEYANKVLDKDIYSFSKISDDDINKIRIDFTERMKVKKLSYEEKVDVLLDTFRDVKDANIEFTKDGLEVELLGLSKMILNSDGELEVIVYQSVHKDDIESRVKEIFG